MNFLGGGEERKKPWFLSEKNAVPEISVPAARVDAGIWKEILNVCVTQKKRESIWYFSLMKTIIAACSFSHDLDNFFKSTLCQTVVFSWQGWTVLKMQQLVRINFYLHLPIVILIFV